MECVPLFSANSFAPKEFVRVVGAHSPYISGAESHFRKSTIPPQGKMQQRGMPIPQKHDPPAGENAATRHANP
ncbi:MAG: hypothetical protein RSI33_10555, partial [Clostridia bacterium]